MDICQINMPAFQQDYFKYFGSSCFAQNSRSRDTKGCNHQIQLIAYLVVKERKSSDEVVHAIESGLNEVLAVVAEELKEGNHGKAAICRKA